MAIQVSFIFAQVQRHFSDIDQSTFLDLFNEYDNEIEPDIRIVPQASTTLNLVQGQVEYPLVPDISRVLEVGMYQSVNSYIRLTPVTVDFLDYRRPGWRANTVTGQPVNWYELGGNIGFYPTPDQTTSGGYPIVNIFQISQGAPYIITDSLPAEPHVAKAWTYGVCLKWAIMVHPDRVQMFLGLEKDAKQSLKRYLQGRNLRRKPKVISRIPTVRFS